MEPMENAFPHEDGPQKPAGKGQPGQGEEHEQERVIFEGRIPVKAFVGKHGLLYLLFLGWNLGLLIAWLQRLSWKLKVTTQRLVIIRGMISQKEEDIPLYRCNDSSFRQTIAGRLLGTGEVTVNADDPTAPSYTFAMVRPQEIKEHIRNHMMIERKRMRSLEMD
jgi:ribosomal protein L15